MATHRAKDTSCSQALFTQLSDPTSVFCYREAKAQAITNYQGESDTLTEEQ